jgi:hypothetical protein
VDLSAQVERAAKAVARPALAARIPWTAQSGVEIEDGLMTAAFDNGSREFHLA